MEVIGFPHIALKMCPQMFYVYMSVPLGLPKIIWCVPAWTVIPLNAAPQLCAVVALAAPLAIQKLPYCWAGAFNCQSPGAWEWSMCTDALSQSMQFYQTKCAIVIQDRWQVQKPMNARFLLCKHPHTEQEGDWAVPFPRQTCEDEKNPYFLSRDNFILFFNWIHEIKINNTGLK